jgi:hypothetical protein
MLVAVPGFETFRTHYGPAVDLPLTGIGKAIPLQSLTGPEVSSRLRLPDFKTIGT